MAKFNKLVKGEILSESQFYKVLDMKGSRVQLENDLGEKIVVDSDYVDKCLQSATQFSSEEKITRTQAAETFLQNSFQAITVCFNKKVKDSEVVTELLETFENSTPKDLPKSVKASVKKALQGEERVMSGRHFGATDDFGRVYFIDMNEDKGTGDYDGRQRLVDPRTINWFIVDGTKYVTK
jgi:hypothetical protein